MESVRQAVVLIVDDEVANLKVFERVFRKDLRVIAVATGAAAIEAAATQAPDLALVDLRMPQMGGIEVLTELRRVNPAMRRYLLTGYCDEAEATAAVQSGLCAAVLSKPWDRATILAVVEGALAGPGAERRSECA